MSDILKVRQGETITLPVEFTNAAGVLVDPSVSQRIRIADPDHTLIPISGSATVAAMETDGGVTGKWKYDHDVAADARPGKWAYQGEGIDGADNHVEFAEGEFEVQAAFPAKLD